MSAYEIGLIVMTVLLVVPCAMIGGAVVGKWIGERLADWWTK